VTPCCAGAATRRRFKTPFAGSEVVYERMYAVPDRFRFKDSLLGKRPAISLTHAGSLSSEIPRVVSG
jgi:hypothetical protein